MLFACVMAGLLLGYHLTVFVVVIFQHPMHLAVPMVLFLPSDIAKSVTLLLRYSPKFVMMSRLNVISNHSRRKYTGLQFVMMMSTLISILGNNCHQHALFDTCVFNSLAPSNKLSTLSAAFCKHEQEKHWPYEEGFKKWNMAVIPLWFSQLQVEWEKLLLSCINI